MSLPDLDFKISDRYANGFEDAILIVLKKFEKELWIATKEDPHYAAYVEEAIKIVKSIPNPPLKG